MFDRDAAHAAFSAGLSESRQSTQSWDVEGWAQFWRVDGQLQPGILGEQGGAWWFRAITDPGRLEGRFGGVSDDPLTASVARVSLAAFIDAANQLLVHWPKAALAPVAFPLRESLGANEAFHLIVEGLGPEHAVGFVPWLGPLTSGETHRMMTAVTEPELVASLARHGGLFEQGIQQLGESPLAAELAAEASDDVFVAWAVEAARVPRDALHRATDADDRSFAAIARKLLPLRAREVWEQVVARPIPELVPDVVRRLDDPVAPWVIRFLRAGDDDVLDALLNLADGRSAQAKLAVRAIGHLDQTDVLTRLDRLDAPQRERLRASLGPSFEHLPELPRSDWRPWVTAVSQRPFAAPDWLKLQELPPLATVDGFRLPGAVRNGLLALLMEVEFDLSGDGRSQDRYDSSLDELRGWLDRDSANAFWNSLFAMWWTNHQPDVRWVVYAAAFLCDGKAIRDLGAKLKRHKTWFGHLSPRVIAALGHSPTRWALAALDDIARRSRNAAHRELANRFLAGHAEGRGLTVDRLVESSFPDERDPLLDELATSRLEEAMCAGRHWSMFTWNELLAAPAFRDAAPNVLWMLEDSWGDLVFVRRDNEEFVDVNDEPVLPGEDSWVAVAHPAQLHDDELEAWNARFADYELVQPFDQLERKRFRAQSLSRDGFVSPTGVRFAGRELLAEAAVHGWEPVTFGAHGAIVGIQRMFPLHDVYVFLALNETLTKSGRGESSLGPVVFRASDKTKLDAESVPVVAFSEAYRDLTIFTSNLKPRESP